jgi:hypothetical protein
MPKVKNPLLSMEARGGIGGLVYNTWRGINTVKTNTSPTGQGTPKRLAAQAMLAAISKDWQTLDDAQRAAWGVYASDHPVPDWTGSPKRLTGQNWFMKCNVILAKIVGTPITDPPAAPQPDAMTGFALSQVINALCASWSLPIAATFTIMWFAVGPLSTGVQAKIEQAQFLRADPAQSVQPWELIQTPGAGRWTVFSKVVDEATGLCSPWASAFLDIA